MTDYDRSREELLGYHCLTCGGSQRLWATKLSIAPRYPQSQMWCSVCRGYTLHELDDTEGRHRLDDGRVGGQRVA